MTVARADAPRWRELTLFLLTAGVFLLCGLIVRPFVPALVGAATLAIVTIRPYRWLESKIARPSLASAVCVLAVTLSIVAPAFFLLRELVQQLQFCLRLFRDGAPQRRVAEFLAHHPAVAQRVATVADQADLGEAAQKLTNFLAAHMAGMVGSSVGAITQLVLMLFILFFLYRDHPLALTALRSLLPLGPGEIDRLFARVADTMYATTLGRLVVASVQGALAAAAFWLLGVKGAILWGFLTVLVAVVPPVGAIVVWAPIAIYLGLSGHWGKAAILAVWGSLVVSSVDNFLYPMLVGSRLSQHTVMVMISLLGGVALFGVSGLILGPVLLTVTKTLLEIWKERNGDGESLPTNPETQAPAVR